MRLRIMVFLLFLAGNTPVSAQQVVDFFLDPAGKPYYLLADDRLVTANKLGENTYSFYDSSLGSPDYVDVTNPFQILVYYREYGIAVILDRTLSELDRIDLFANQAIRQPGAIARSYDNGIWVFDNWEYRLLRLNENGRADQQTNDLRLQLELSNAPDAIFVDRNAVALYFATESRLAVFTNYGKFQQWVSVPAGSRLSWYAPRLLGIGKTGNWVWSPERETVSPLGPLPEQLATARRIVAGPQGYITNVEGELRLVLRGYTEKN